MRLRVGRFRQLQDCWHSKGDLRIQFMIIYALDLWIWFDAETLTLFGSRQPHFIYFGYGILF